MRCTDDVVKVSGKLASPSDVTAVLLEIDGVAGAITIPVVTEGATRLVAHVEIADESTVRLDDLRRALRRFRQTGKTVRLIGH